MVAMIITTAALVATAAETDEVYDDVSHVKVIEIVGRNGGNQLYLIQWENCCNPVYLISG